MSAEPENRPSCADAADPESLTVAEARRRIVQAMVPLIATERVALRDGLDRVLGETVRAPQDVPLCTNSAMDGYALAGGDLPAEGTREVECIGDAFAGHPFTGRVYSGQCVRIMTGAPMPEGTDTVVMQEQARAEGGRISIGNRHRPGQNVRQAGEDIARGEPVLGPGRTLTPADLGLLASVGVAEIAVRRRPRVAFFSTGDELRSVGQPLGAGDVYDSNRYTLFGMLRRAGVQVSDLGVVPDEPAALESALRQAAVGADAVITSGGVSVGEADYVKGLLERLGEPYFWKIAMKPGRPLTFGRVGDAWFFGLPGNPVAVMVTFYQFVLPALSKLATGHEQPPLLFDAVSESDLRKRPGRTEFLRGILGRTADGRLTVRTTGKQGSGVLRSMSLADCFIVLPDASGDVQAGQLVTVQPFAGLI